MKYRIRKKGKYEDGTNKYVVEQIDGNQILQIVLPKPIYMWKILKNRTQK